MTSRENIHVILSQLGIDPELFRWQHLADCLNMHSKNAEDPDYFFDDYEGNVAKQIDEICVRCPVIKECFKTGTESGETGVWGGFYLENGKVCPKKNKHKTREMVIKLSGMIND